MKVADTVDRVRKNMMRETDSKGYFELEGMGLPLKLLI
jgi:hypothetical protein